MPAEVLHRSRALVSEELDVDVAHGRPEDRLLPQLLVRGPKARACDHVLGIGGLVEHVSFVALGLELVEDKEALLVPRGADDHRVLIPISRPLGPVHGLVRLGIVPSQLHLLVELGVYPAHGDGEEPVLRRVAPANGPHDSVRCRVHYLDPHQRGIEQQPPSLVERELYLLVGDVLGLGADKRRVANLPFRRGPPPVLDAIKGKLLGVVLLVERLQSVIVLGQDLARGEVEQPHLPVRSVDSESPACGRHGHRPDALLRHGVQIRLGHLALPREPHGRG
mmetsp:Transcript_29115/g.58143  ORF Transcript_29115/g.58143 Transcript_29115/m.58143 type:complete len:279 (+) Transcript_29115:607-1443(+)